MATLITVVKSNMLISIVYVHQHAPVTDMNM